MFFGLFEVHALANQIPQWKVQFSDILKTFIVESYAVIMLYINWVNLVVFPYKLLCCLQTNKQTKMM